MKVSAKQKARLVEKYVKLCKEVIPDYLENDDRIYEWLGDYSFDNIKQEAKLVGVPFNGKNDDHFGFKNDREFDDFCDIQTEAINKAMKIIFKQIRKS